MPGQQLRKSVRRKLNANRAEFRDKNVLLVDDSIVRGTTSEQIIEMAREAGAKKVYLASAAPEIRFPNVYGIDMPTANELIAHGREVDEIRQIIGADGLIFQDLNDLIDAVRAENRIFSSLNARCSTVSTSPKMSTSSTSTISTLCVTTMRKRFSCRTKLKT
jgi:amidophosphoribosyltransferase